MATLKWYGKAFEALATKQINFTSDTFKLMLLKPGYLLDATKQANHFAVSDVSPYECAGSAGYTGSASRATLPALTSQSEATLVWTARWTMSGNTWTAVTMSGAGNGFQYVVCFDDSTGGTDATRKLIWIIDNAAETIPTAQNIIVTLPAAGTLQITAA